MHKFKKHFIKPLIVAASAGIAAVLFSNFSASGETPQTQEAQVNSSSSLPSEQKQSLPSQDTKTPTYLVIACNDGDTCRLKAPDNTQIKVRLVGIDAPEMGKKSKKKKKEGQAGGQEAKDFLNKLVVGKTVTLRSYGADAYGRNLAEIIIDNQPANLKMVSEGLAEVYRGKPPRGFDLTPYQSAQEEAMKSKKGIWGMQDYESPKEFRKRTKN